jgi:hypothetical protein
MRRCPRIIDAVFGLTHRPIRKALQPKDSRKMDAGRNVRVELQAQTRLRRLAPAFAPLKQCAGQVRSGLPAGARRIRTRGPALRRSPPRRGHWVPRRSAGESGLEAAKKHSDGSGKVINALAMAASYNPDPTQFLGIRLPVTFDTCEVTGWTRA